MHDVEPSSDLSDDVLWGVAAIATYIKRKRSATYYLIAEGLIPAKKLGARTIMARKSELDRALAAGVIEPTQAVQRVKHKRSGR
jgi:hypothetical protein